MPDEGLEDSSDVLIQIPQELLVRVSVTSDTECSSQSSYDEPLGELEVPASQSGLEGRSGDFPPGVQPQGGSLPLTRLSGDGHETESLPAPQAAASQLTPAAESLSLNTGAALVVTQPVSSVQSEAIVPGRGERSASSDQPVPHPSDDALSTPQFDVDQLLQGLSREGGTAVPDWLGEDGEENADATLIGDEAEPTVMREADEFSQFEPTHLASMMSRESFLQSTGRPVTTGQESGARQTHPTTTTTMTTSTASIVSGSGSTRGLLQRQQQVTATRFPATVDRHHVLHGDLKLSEQVRPVVEGFTDQDEFSLAGARSTAHRDPSEAALQGSQRTEAIASEGYFSAGQRSELDVSDLRTAEGQQLDAGSDSDEEYASARGESATSLAMGDTTSVSREVHVGSVCFSLGILFAGGDAVEPLMHPSKYMYVLRTLCYICPNMLSLPCTEMGTPVTLKSKKKLSMCVPDIVAKVLSIHSYIYNWEGSTLYAICIINSMAPSAIRD